MIDIDFIIFSYLPTREILKIFEFYFAYGVQNTKNIASIKVLNLYLGNKLLIAEIEDKYPVKIKCKYKIHPGEVSWGRLSANPNAIQLLEQNPDKIHWDMLSLNPNGIKLLSQNMDKINWKFLLRNSNAIHLLEQNPDKIDWAMLSRNPNAIHLLEAVI